MSPRGRGRQPACRAPGGQSQSSSSPAEPLQFYFLIPTHWERSLEAPRKMPQLRPERDRCGSSCLGRQLLSWGRERVKRGRGDRRSPAHVFHMVLLIFPRAACPPPSFPSCPVGRSTAAKRSLCSVASCQGWWWWWFCSSWQWTAKHHPPHSRLSLESRSHRPRFVPGKKLSLKRRTRRIFFFKLFFPFCFLNWNMAVVFP